MKTLLVLAAGSLALTGLSACTRGPAPLARTALDCPATQGDLQRVSIAPDQKTCTYTTRDGDQVSLRLVSAAGGYRQALEPIEQELQGEILTDAQAGKAKVAEATAEAASAEAKSAESVAKDAAAEVKSSTAEAKGAALAARQAAEDALGEAKDAEKDARGDADESTRIDLSGIHIDADEGGKADVNVGPIHVNAGENGAVIRLDRDVRLRGEAFSREKRGFRATYILANENLKDGWSAVGYEAGGPKAGPVTVAVVKSHNGNHHDVFDDVKRLVRRNADVVVY
ncbi:MAG: hypothetical protein ACXWKR_00475 [Phenylobacterium sp.]